MTDNIKELVKHLRSSHDWRGLSLEAADALEAMAGEVELVRAERHRAQTACEQIAVRLHAAEAERDRLKAALDVAKDHAKQNQRVRDFVSPYPNDHAKRIVWEKTLYHEGKDLWDKLCKALGEDVS